MRLEATLDRLHARVVQNPWLRLFTAMTRGLLALGFIVPSLPKLMGQPFTQLPPSHPVGYFFDAFFQAEGFYFFVGAAQMAAGLLLLFARTAPLGAVLYFPIILNVFVVTVSIGFGGTQQITALMLLACTYLLCWDYDRWKTLLPGFSPAASLGAGRHLGVQYALPAGLIAGLGGAGAGTAGLAILEGGTPVGPLLAMGVAAALALGYLWIYARGLSHLRAAR